MAERRRRFQFCITRFQSVRRLFLQLRIRNFVVLASRQPESRTLSRAPVYQILWVRAFRDHTISRPGFNLIKSLRRHSPATRFPVRFSRAEIPASEAPRLEIDDRLGDLCQDGGAGTNIERPRCSGKKFVGRRGRSFSKSDQFRVCFFTAISICYLNLHFRDASFKPGRRAHPIRNRGDLNSSKETLA